MNKSIILTGNKGFIGRYLEKELNKSGYNVIGYDMEKNLEDEDIVNKIMSINNKSKYLINAFAINDHIDNKESKKTSLSTTPLESFKRYMDVNVSSLYSVCSEFIKTRETGNIINFSSIYGLLSPNPKIYEENRSKAIGYSISKSSVISLTKYLAAHYAPKFRVNSLALGGIYNNQNLQFVKNYSDIVPINRMMKIEEVLPSILFLIDDNNSYMTGSTLTIDGGYSII
tara:strand:- start:530 stop:1213 length:684 start_codon:yes stop_codon:yes gene_type:complete